MKNQKTTQSRRMTEQKLLKLRGNRIIEEVIDGNDSTIDTMDNFNNDLDVKYELFCKWLQQNENDIQLSERNDRSNLLDAGNGDGGPTLTEDEVSSFATNSDDDDDSANDIFVDTESEQPIILVNGMDEMGSSVATTDTMAFRANTPSQLSVGDFDCSSSDVTVNSNGQINGNPIKRKPKHKKGRAPPIPTVAMAAANDTNLMQLDRETDI